ncbi:MAG: formyltetrahydrofolate deformylase [Bdellovibrionales bacterium]|nr:formyltetrahydrofolate deformylase [Bdellovibrionales bacterium]
MSGTARGKSPARHVLLVACADGPGLIHRITGVLFRHGLNIVENHEYVEKESGTFTMRTEVDGDAPIATVAEELRRELPKGAEVSLHAQTPKRVVVLATKESHCLGDLLLRHAAGELAATIPAVVSQYAELAPLVKRFEIPFHHVPAEGLEREAHEAELEKVIVPYAPEYLVLAKYMRVLTPGFVGKYRNRILNIHHSFLPAFVGKNPYAQAYARGVKIIGATAHFVNEALDEGPIITQSVIPVTHNQDAATLARAGRDVEKIVLSRALRLLLEDRVIVRGQRTLVFE